MNRKVQAILIFLIIGLLTACEFGNQPTQESELVVDQQSQQPVEVEPQDVPVAPEPEAGNESDAGDPDEVVGVINTVTNTLVSYPIVDTGQSDCYDNENVIICPEDGTPFFGQDAQHVGMQPAYIDNGDGTISDVNSGLMWQKMPGEKLTYDEAMANIIQHFLFRCAYH